MAGDIATDFYRAERRAQGVYGRFSPRIAELPPVEQVEKSVAWASQDVLALPRDRADAQDVIVAARTKLEGVTDKLVLDVGRNTLIENIERDRKAHAWARIPEADCCYFCAMLSTRGAVYRTEETASFEAHDHCRCNVEPLFGDVYEPTAQVREWQALYVTAQKNAPPGVDKINEFRRWFEGRQDAPRRSTD